ncbi:DUF4271 domain-containing protein [Flavobacterium sp.]|uniref:DUF4271 domain-containing protein n=1 Tax=Flavobacterium sp. TaxID=239 RepID=UPI003A8DF17B
MTDFVLHERITDSKDWATILFVFCFVLIAANRSVFGARFAEFSKLALSNKYIKIYKDSGNMTSSFTISFFFVQLVSFSFFIQFLLSYFGSSSKSSLITFVQIFTFLSFFILSKYLTEKIIATSFNIEEFNEQFNLMKVNYRTYIGLVLLPLNAILFYNSNPSPFVVYTILTLIIMGSLYSYIVSLKTYQNLILGKLFYFILYLCTLEIAPYYFMYYWFTKS